MNRRRLCAEVMVEKTTCREKAKEKSKKQEGTQL